MAKELHGQGGPGRGQGRKAKFGKPLVLVAARVTRKRKRWLDERGTTKEINRALDQAGAPK